MSMAERRIPDRLSSPAERLFKSWEVLLLGVAILIFVMNSFASPYFLDAWNLSDATFNFTEKAMIAFAMALGEALRFRRHGTRSLAGCEMQRRRQRQSQRRRRFQIVVVREGKVTLVQKKNEELTREKVEPLWKADQLRDVRSSQLEVQITLLLKKVEELLWEKPEMLQEAVCAFVACYA